MQLCLSNNGENTNPDCGNYAACNKYATKQALQFVTPMMSYNATFDNQIWL